MTVYAVMPPPTEAELKAELVRLAHKHIKDPAKLLLSLKSIEDGNYSINAGEVTIGKRP